MVELFPETIRDSAVPRSDAPGHTPALPSNPSASAKLTDDLSLKLWRPVLVRAVGLGLGALFLAGVGSASLLSQGTPLGGLSLSQLRAAALLDTGGSDWVKPSPLNTSATQSKPDTGLTHAARTPLSRVSDPGVRDEGTTNETTARGAPVPGEPTNDSSAESPSTNAGTTAPEKLILNEATSSELRRLPGVGARRAEQILALRAQLGRFRKLSDLLRVKGIGPKLFRRMLPMLVLDRPAQPASPAASPSAKPRAGSG